MEHVAILGGNSTIGQHLIGSLSSLPTIKLIHIWTYSDKFTYRLPDNNNFDDSRIVTFLGTKALESAVQECDTVFNLHEFQDFTLLPDKKRLQEHNVECKFRKTCVKRVVQLSSIYLQCSCWWPNIGGREADFKIFEKEAPFAVYCRSKNDAEQMMLNCRDFQKVIARVGSVYGEGDRCSLVCDAIYWSKFSNNLPVVGDRGGALQATYAGNVAGALCHFADKMSIDTKIDNEIVLVQDDTPTKDVYESVLKPLYKNEARQISSISIPFYVIFSIYLLLSMFAWISNNIFGNLARFEQLPSPAYLYFVFRHWTFLSGFKQRVFFDYVPKFSYGEAIHRSKDYYHRLFPEDIAAFSWCSYPM